MSKGNKGMSNYTTNKIYVNQDGSYTPRGSHPSTDQEKVLIDLFNALEYHCGEEPKNEIFFWYADAPGVVMTFNDKGYCPRFRGETEDECLKNAKQKLILKYMELCDKYNQCKEAANNLKILANNLKIFWTGP